MSQSALYLGSRCPPNMEAYLDSLLYRTTDDATTFEVIVVGDCDLPGWLTDIDRVTIARYNAPQATGLGRVRVTAQVVRRYLRSHDPEMLRQITQPRWHAPGVLAGAIRHDVCVCTRAAVSLFGEFHEAPSPVRAWLANNVLGQSIFLADAVYTPRYGGVDLPWWAPADLVVEARTVNAERFSPDVEPRSDLFSQDYDRVLTVGRISRRKGTDILLSVADRLPKVEFAVVGPVDDEDLATAADKVPNIRRHPPVNYVEMPGLYTAADLVLSLSRLEWGGVSRAMLEGKASGCPVVALEREHAEAVADSTVPDEPEAIAATIRHHLD